MSIGLKLKSNNDIQLNSWFRLVVLSRSFCVCVCLSVPFSLFILDRRVRCPFISSISLKAALLTFIFSVSCLYPPTSPRHSPDMEVTRRVRQLLTGPSWSGDELVCESKNLHSRDPIPLIPGRVC